MTHVLLARHGETEWNRAGRIQGHSDSLLSGVGIAQAARLAVRLSQLPIRAIYASDLSRAGDTAVPVADALGLPVLPLPDLREKGFGAWEGLTLDEVRAADPEGWQRYFGDGEFDAPVPGGETWTQVQARMAEALRRVLRDHPGADDTVLLVGHGGSLRTLITDALNAPLSAIRHFTLSNASLSRLDFRAGWETRVTLLNDTSHWENQS